MVRLRLLLALVPALPLITYGGACGQPRATSLGLVMESPLGLLDQATTVSLQVFPVGSSKCGTDGAVSDVPSDGVQTFPLGKTQCPSGDTWCATIELDRDDSTQMFSVVATSPAGTLAQGCTTAAIDQDPLSVTIQVKRYIEPGCCNDGKVQVGEQCDTGVASAKTCSGGPGGKCQGIVADAVCDCGCYANEILLSIDDSDAPLLKNGAPGTKTGLALAFTPGEPQIDRALRAVYVNTGTDAKGLADINERFLKPDLYPYVASDSKDPYPLSFALMMPVLCAYVQDATQNGFVNRQQAPAIAAVGQETAVVYMSDEKQGGNFDIFLVPQGIDGCDDAHSCTAASDCATGSCVSGFCAASEQLSVTGPVPGASDPDIAGGPADSGLAVWTVGSSVYGRIWKVDGTLIPAISPILIAESGSAAKVAGNADGFRVVYQGAGAGDTDGIFMKTVDASGVVGAEVRVNTATAGTQDHPGIAMLEDGRSMVVWHSAGHVYFQRYDPKGTSIADDQNAPLDTTTAGDHLNPSIAASIGIGDFFAVDWETDDADVFARFAGATSGFGYNTIDGQNGDFKATYPITGERHHPAVTIGGGGYVVFGWEDVSTSHPGVFVRRFPVPTEF